MTQDEINQLKNEMRSDMIEEQYQERQLRKDFTLCFTACGGEDVVTALHKLQSDLKRYDWDLSIDELQLIIREYI